MSDHLAHLPLRGVTILDLTRAVAGPFCTMSLGDLGARVIKVEEPGLGDETRHWGPPFVEKESAYFLSLNRNKESIELDLKKEEGREALRRLAHKADVVVENFRPDVMDRLGIGYEMLRVENPRLIYASISGFGQTGAQRLKPGYDLIVQAISGLLRSNAGPGGKPAKASFPVADILAALFTCQAILAALFHRERTGEGQQIHVSLLEALLASMCPLSSSYLLAGPDSAAATMNSNVVPYQVFDCQDEPIVIGVPNERIWKRFCDALDRPEWLSDERYTGNGERNRNRLELVRAIEEVLRGRCARQWLAILEENEVPCGPILSVGEVFEDPHLLSEQSIVQVKHEKYGPLRLLASPMRFSGVELDYRSPPELGEHTALILKELDCEFEAFSTRKSVDT
jgi:crotonobetainyl-CoA:carnitine CoA-transferase CaiB-like acyl-CoA transferase